MMYGLVAGNVINGRGEIGLVVPDARPGDNYYQRQQGNANARPYGKAPLLARFFWMWLRPLRCPGAGLHGRRATGRVGYSRSALIPGIGCACQAIPESDWEPYACA